MARSYTRKGNNLPVDRIREVFAYDPEIGTLKWNIAFRGVAAGSMAGYLNPAGNYVIGFDRQTHQATRIAWAHHYGVWPDGHIVPANGVKHDIRILNLKHQSRAETVRSSKMRTTNKSGYRGVSWNARERKWVASISRDYRRVHLGFLIVPRWLRRLSRKCQQTAFRLMPDQNCHASQWRRPASGGSHGK